MIVFPILALILALIILVRSSTLLINSLNWFSRFFLVPEFVIAFFLMAIATSVPELFVGITSTLTGNQLLSLGNILGANVIGLTIVVGLPTILGRGIKIQSKTEQKDIFVSSLLSTAPLFLLLDRTLSRLDGIILLIIITSYFVYVLRSRKDFTKIGEPVYKKDFFRNVLYFTFGIVLLLISAYLAVRMASDIAVKLNIPMIVMGIFIISLGTTLPELIFGIKSVIAKRESMAIGNALGTVAVNSCLVLGLVAVIRPIEILNFRVFMGGAIFLLTSVFFFNLFVRRDENLSWREGVILCLIYLLFVVTEVIVKQ
jgi:cation:H+ antiporter